MYETTIGRSAKGGHRTLLSGTWRLRPWGVGAPGSHGGSARQSPPREDLGLRNWSRRTGVPTVIRALDTRISGWTGQAKSSPAIKQGHPIW